MIPKDKIEFLVERYSFLEKELSSQTVEKKEYASKSKEYSDLSEIIVHAKEYLSFDSNKSDLEKIIDDTKTETEMKEMAKNELKDILNKKNINEKILKIFLIPKDEADQKNAILEIRAGTGGLEASLFAADLFKMYEKISVKKKWVKEIINFKKTMFFMINFKIRLK